MKIKHRITGEVIHDDANLSGTNLSGANLRDADLSYANLQFCNLSYADLSGADLRFCNGNNKQVKSLQTGIWLVVMTKKGMCIGCESHTLKEWRKFTDDEIKSMDCQALEFWKEWKRTLFMVHKRAFK